MTARPALLVLVRHGQSQRNVAKKRNRFFLDDEARRPIRDIPDHRIGLTEMGWKQARETGLAVRERFGPFDQVYHSGYQRAVDTTTAMLDAHAPEVRVRMRVRHHLFIRERDQGPGDGDRVGPRATIIAASPSQATSTASSTRSTSPSA